MTRCRSCTRQTRAVLASLWYRGPDHSRWAVTMTVQRSAVVVGVRCLVMKAAVTPSPVTPCAAAAKSADGRGPQTCLLERFLSHFQLSAASDLIPAVYSDEFGRAEIAELAPIAFSAAEEGDSVADQIVHAAADQLAQCVSTIATRLSFCSGEFVLSLSGSVLLNQPKFRDRVRGELTKRSSGPGTVVLVRDPVVGAVVLAALQ